MPPTMRWLAIVVRLAIMPVLVGALFFWLDPERPARHIAAGFGLVALGAIHLAYWWRPWPTRPRRSLVAAGAMLLTNGVLIHLLGLSQPLLWLYPALVMGAGLPPPASVVGVILMAVVAHVPSDLDSTHVIRTLGPAHNTVLALAVTLAGLGMAAVRQLVAVNADLHTTRAELAEAAVAADRERLARELHDVLGRTLSLIAVKAELASRLSAQGDPSAAAELRDVQQLARDAVREVREAVTGDSAPSVAGELAAACLALRSAGIEARVEDEALDIHPAHEATIAWALREGVTNVLRHSGARFCTIVLRSDRGATELEIVDDGHGGPVGAAGLGLVGLADRVHALGGTFEAGSLDTGGFRLCARLESGAIESVDAGSRDGAPIEVAR